MSLTSMEYRTEGRGPSARKADHLRTNEDVGEAELFQPVRRFERLRQSAPALDLMAGQRRYHNRDLQTAWWANNPRSGSVADTATSVGICRTAIRTAPHNAGIQFLRGGLRQALLEASAMAMIKLVNAFLTALSVP